MVFLGIINSLRVAVDKSQPKSVNLHVSVVVNNDDDMQTHVETRPHISHETLLMLRMKHFSYFTLQSVEA